MQNSNYIMLSPKEALAYCQKAGSTTFRSVFAPTAHMRNVGQVFVAENAEIVRFFLRNPVQRLQSAYRWFNSQGSWPVRFHPDIRWEEFVDHVLAGDATIGDKHWIGQVEQHTYGDRFLPTHVERFENLRHVWPLWFPNLRLVHHKASPAAVKTTQYRLQDIYDHYKADTDLWFDLDPTTGDNFHE